MDDNIGAVFDRPNQIGARKRVVDNQRQAILSCDVADLLDVNEFAARICQTLDENPARLVINPAFKAGDVVRVGPAHLPSEVLESVTKLVDRAPVKLSGGNEILPGPHEAVEDQKLSAVTRSRRQP